MSAYIFNCRFLHFLLAKNNPIVGSLLPVSGLGALLSFVYWGLLLISSYQLAVFLKKEKHT